MKNKTLSILCMTLFMTLLSSGNVKAIERIRYNAYESTNSQTIIRRYEDHADIACYHNSNNPYFMFYREGVASSHAMYLDRMDTIFDFEIFNDTVYFSGKQRNSVSGKAVVGYFDAASFLSSSPTNVSYISLPSMDVVKAIEVKNFAARKHVVGIGRSLTSMSMMVDMIDESSYWKVNFSDVGGDSIILHDLAITDSFVVVTSTMKTFFMLTTGRLWYIPKPFTPGQSLFPNFQVHRKDHTGVIPGKYLIQHQAYEGFYTAFMGRKNVFSTPKVYVSHFFNKQHDWSVSINEGSQSSYSLQEMAIEEATWTVELLMSEKYTGASGTSVRSKVYEIYYDYSTPVTISAHLYDGLFLTSIDRVDALFIGDGHYIMSGTEAASGYGSPYYAKFKHQIFGNCWDRMYTTMENASLSFSQKHNMQINNTMILQLPEVIETEKKTMTVVTTCSSSKVSEDGNNENE